MPLASAKGRCSVCVVGWGGVGGDAPVGRRDAEAGPQLRHLGLSGRAGRTPVQPAGPDRQTMAWFVPILAGRSPGSGRPGQPGPARGRRRESGRPVWTRACTRQIMGWFLRPGRTTAGHGMVGSPRAGPAGPTGAGAGATETPPGRRGVCGKRLRGAAARFGDSSEARGRYGARSEARGCFGSCSEAHHIVRTSSARPAPAHKTAAFAPLLPPRKK